MECPKVAAPALDGIYLTKVADTGRVGNWMGWLQSWAQLVGALRVHPHKHAPIIVRQKIREVANAALILKTLEIPDHWPPIRYS